MLESIRMCTQVINASAIDQAAYIRASAEKKQLDLTKFKQDIRRELNSPTPSDSTAGTIVQT